MGDHKVWQYWQFFLIDKIPLKVSSRVNVPVYELDMEQQTGAK